MRVLHVISGLGTGGAEIMLLRTVQELLREGMDCQVCSIVQPGPVGDQLTALGVPVLNLGARSSLSALRVISSLTAHLESTRPDLIHSWMYHANVAVQIACRSHSHIPVVGSVHHSLDDETDASLSRHVVRLLDARWSVRSAAVVFASQRGMEQHLIYGYSRANSIFLPNGFDVVKFAPNPQLRQQQRSRLGIESDEFVIGCVARFHPIKDHLTLLRAAEYFLQSSHRARFLLVGRGVSGANAPFASELKKYRLGERCLALGERDDVPALFSAMDVACLSSRSEGFPLTLGEAMACGLNCVATDVGDCAMLLGGTGIIVPPADPLSLARAWSQIETMDTEERAAAGRRSRARIVEQFSMRAYMTRLKAVYLRAQSGRGQSAAES